MKIKQIEYENFMAFEDFGKIEFSTDKRVTAIYGKPGIGKSSVVQLVRWVLYGEIFPYNARAVLYNIEFSSNVLPGKQFNVEGKIFFDHAGVDYLLHRTACYSKSLLSEIKYLHEELELLYKGDDGNWIGIDNPLDNIEKIFPSGLAEYFFFDGEKRNDRHELCFKRAFYSKLNDNVSEMAIKHIGSTKLRTTVLGRLYLNKNSTLSGDQIETVKINIENVQLKIEKLEEKLRLIKTEKDYRKQIITEVSEQICSTKSREDYERQRIYLQNAFKLAQKNIAMLQADFGDLVLDSIDLLLIKSIHSAVNRLNKKINELELPSDLVELVQKYTINTEDKEFSLNKEKAAQILDLMSPRPYRRMRQRLQIFQENSMHKYNAEEMDKFIRMVIHSIEQADINDEAIYILDSEQKKNMGSDIDELVETRQKAVVRIKELDDIIVHTGVELKKANLYLKKQKSEFDKLSKDNQRTQEVDRRIEIMEMVLSYFKEDYAKKTDWCDEVFKNRFWSIVNYITNDFTLYESRGISPGSITYNALSHVDLIILGVANICAANMMLKDSKRECIPVFVDSELSIINSELKDRILSVLAYSNEQLILLSCKELPDSFQKMFVGNKWIIERKGDYSSGFRELS